MIAFVFGVLGEKDAKSLKRWRCGWGRERSIRGRGRELRKIGGYVGCCAKHEALQSYRYNYKIKVTREEKQFDHFHPYPYPFPFPNPNPNPNTPGTES